MTDIAKLKQEAEEARKAAIKEIRYTHTSDFYDPSAIADSLIAATIAQIALQAAEKEAEPNIDGQIISEIYKACELLGAKSDLLGTIGSWRDTMTDEHTLDTLKLLNEHYSKPTPIADNCARSHPHEDMTPECEKKSIEAKAANADTHTWIKWEGGECPVTPETHVCIRWHDGDESVISRQAQFYSWIRNGSDIDIIAYRIISPAADRVGES